MNKPFLVYAIKSSIDKRIYVGMSQSVRARVNRHNSGFVSSTRAWRPWRLIYQEDCGYNRLRAREREKYFKSGIGKEFLRKL